MLGESIKKDNILIVGAGAVGSYFGGRLSQNGALVSTVSRSDYDVVKDRGISIESIDGDFLFRPDEVIKDVSKYSKKADYILVCLKVLPDIDVVDIIKPAVKEGTVIVLIQNGIDIEKDIFHAFPGNEVISSIAYIAVSRIDKGVIRHQNYSRLEMGNYPSGISKKTEHLCKLFREAGTVCSTTKSIESKRWEKLLWNIPFNSMSVIGRSANTEDMIRLKETEILAKSIMLEIVEVARAAGVTLPTELVEKNLQITRDMAPYKTSMLLDFEAGRPLELDAIVGNVVKIATREGVSIPHISTFYALLKLITR